ncbi:MAG: hypothetical protein N2555_05740 [Endomicrobia bacterium]|nr:hypothetical protein [Endomicrobiia bacterium]
MKIITYIIFVFVSVSFISADVIYKKDNTQIETTIISEDEEGVMVEIDGKQQKILWKDIISIKKVEKKSKSSLASPSGFKVPAWKSSVVVGLQGFSMISKETGSNTLIVSFGYQPWRKFEIGINYEVDIMETKISNNESSTIIDSYNLYLRFYYKPTKKDYIAWLEGKTKMNPMKFRYFFGLQMGKSHVKQKTSFIETTTENTNYKIELLGFNWSISPDVSLNLNLLTVNPSRYNPEETDSELEINSSVGLRFLIPVEKK